MKNKLYIALAGCLLINNALGADKVVVVPLGGNNISTCVLSKNNAECGILNSFSYAVGDIVSCIGGGTVYAPIRYLDEQNTNISIIDTGNSSAPPPRIEIRYEIEAAGIGTQDWTYIARYYNGSTYQTLANLNGTGCSMPNSKEAGFIFTSPTGNKWHIAPVFSVAYPLASLEEVQLERAQ